MRWKRQSLRSQRRHPLNRSRIPHRQPKRSAAPAEAPFKLKAYLDKKVLEAITVSGKLEAYPELMLTADIQKVPLQKVLAVLAREAKLKVYIADNVPNGNISAKFDELPLEEGLKQILKDQNYMLTRVETPPSPKNKLKKSFVQVTEIRILPRGSEASGSYQLQEVASAAPVGDDEKKRKLELKKLINQALNADKAEDRLAALEKFSKEADQTVDEGEWAEIEPTLKDADERVRKTALQAMMGLGAPPLDSIADMARTDASPELRISALGQLVEFKGPHATPQLNAALNDPDPSVRERAGELLEEADTISEFLKGKTLPSH